VWPIVFEKLRCSTLYCMASTTFSARLDRSLLERLDRRKEQSEQSRTDLAKRYIDEGLRMDEHPGIVFRGGLAGRRAALAAGPDVWELVRFMRGLPEKGDKAIHEASRLLDLSPRQVRTALGYYTSYRVEIDDRIRCDEHAGRQAEDAWRRQRDALG
jgi:hypothetical protein